MTCGRWLAAGCVALACASVWLVSCGAGSDDGCFSDDDCGYGLVCDRAASSCVDPPGDCNGYCSKNSQCGVEDKESCIKSTCGASFLQYYRKAKGTDCETAWLDLMECESHLSCADLKTYRDQVDPETGTAPFCQSLLRNKNTQC